MSSSLPDDPEGPLPETYLVDLAGLTPREHRAAVAAIEELVGPLRIKRLVEHNPVRIPVLGTEERRTNHTPTPGVPIDSV